ncbi:hypothetical protein AB6A40_005649 [Gnathostoma spinigerum]|uniref:Serine/threonine-protein phosphatase n=1 Tax=Gnathostoma spinigerum TaxID=75299 RepID=A0ABD6EH75_9BILA
MEVVELDYDNLITRLLGVGMAGGRLTKKVSELELIKLCAKAKSVFVSQSSLIELHPPLIVCGDIHGQYSDLLRIFDKNGFPPDTNYLFLGDYVDRGIQNIETISLLLAYKVQFPENFFLLRGNHETSSINRVYGFYDEVNRRYKSPRLWNVYQVVFNWMPLSAIISGRILCMHGGLSPLLNDIEQLRRIGRPIDPPSPSLELDLLWSDPDQWTTGWQPSNRGVSCVFGQDIVVHMCEKLQIDLIARAHQVVQDGYEFFANRRLVTIFSAPHYCGQFDNAAASMSVSEDLSCAFKVYRPASKAVRLAAKQAEESERIRVERKSQDEGSDGEENRKEEEKEKSNEGNNNFKDGEENGEEKDSD